MADQCALSFLEKKGINLQGKTLRDIHEMLARDQGLLAELTAYMLKIEQQCSSTSFAECWRILKELKHR